MEKIKPKDYLAISALSFEEEERIKRLLARDPTAIEHEIIKTLWSEQISYKSSRAYLSNLITKSDKISRVSENIGLLDLGNGQQLGLSIADYKGHHDILALGAKPQGAFLKFSWGLTLKEQAIRPEAKGVKNRLLYVASADDATLEQAFLSIAHADLLEGAQFLGAYGLALAFLMAARASTGLILNIDKAEHFDGLLLISEPKNVARILEIIGKFGLLASDIGVITGDGVVRIYHQNQEVVNLPAKLIIENAPRYRHELAKEPAEKKTWPSLPSAFKESKSGSFSKIFNENGFCLSFFQYENLDEEESKRAVWESYLSLAEQNPLAVGVSFAGLKNRVRQAVDGASEALSACGIVPLAYHTAIEPLARLGLLFVLEKEAAIFQPKKGDHLIMLGDLPEISEKKWQFSSVLALHRVLNEIKAAELSSFSAIINQGGLLGALLKLLHSKNLGAHINFGPEWLRSELDLGLLSQDSPRALLSIKDNKIDMIQKICAHQVSLHRLGKLTKEDLLITHQGRPIFRATKQVMGQVSDQRASTKELWQELC